MRAAGIDWGKARVGIAVADELGTFAHPRGTFPAKPEPALLEALRTLVEAEAITLWVMGLPLDMSGTEGEAARTVRAAAARVARATGCPVEFVDERLSTVQAHRELSASDVRGRDRKGLVDQAAAVILLQSYLDAARARARQADVDAAEGDQDYVPDYLREHMPDDVPAPASPNMRSGRGGDRGRVRKGRR